MIKNNKIKFIISSLIILLPMLIGIFGGKLLPEEIAVHWGLNGEADGYTRCVTFSKEFAILTPACANISAELQQYAVGI